MSISTPAHPVGHPSSPGLITYIGVDAELRTALQVAASNLRRRPHTPNPGVIVIDLATVSPGNPRAFGRDWPRHHTRRCEQLITATVGEWTTRGQVDRVLIAGRDNTTTDLTHAFTPWAANLITRIRYDHQLAGLPSPQLCTALLCAQTNPPDTARIVTQWCCSTTNYVD